MKDRAELASYVVARWSALVRTLVLLGLSPEEADAVALDGMARCVPGFDAAARDEDVDLWVWREVLSRRSAVPSRPPDVALVTDATVPDREERLATLRRVVVALGALDEAPRVALALSLGAGHDPGTAAELAGAVPDPALAPPEDQVVAALAVVPLRADPAAGVLALAAARRRRRTRWSVGVAAGVVLVLALGAGVAWLVAPEVEPDLPEATVTAAPNRTNIPWYGAGVLHLARVEVDVPPVRELVEVPDGAVYADTSGRVVLADQEGTLTRLGTVAPEGALAGWPERGWVAWVDVSGGHRQMVAYDTVTRREIARRTAEPDAVVVAVDQGQVYYDVAGDPWSWSPGQDITHEPSGSLVDVASGVRVTRAGADLVRISQPLFDVEVDLPGTSAALSPEGDYVMVRSDERLPDELVVYRAGDGRREPPHLTADEVALAAGFGKLHTISYLVAIRDHAPEDGDFVRLSETGPVTLRTCDLDLDQCLDVMSMANTRGAPVFPR